MSFSVSLSSQSDSASIFLSLSTSLFPSLLIEFSLGQSLCLSLIFPPVQCSTEWHWDNPDVGDKLSHMKLAGRLPWLWGCWSCVPRQHCKELRHKCARLWSSHLNAINSACFCAGTLGLSLLGGIHCCRFSEYCQHCCPVKSHQIPTFLSEVPPILAKWREKVPLRLTFF